MEEKEKESGNFPTTHGDCTVYASEALCGTRFHFHTPAHTFVLNVDDGSILLDGKPVESLSHPDIKEILSQIARSLQENSMTHTYGRQTEFLLSELAKCREENEELKKRLSINAFFPQPR